eukprot:gene1471-1627_t
MECATARHIARWAQAQGMLGNRGNNQRECPSCLFKRVKITSQRVIFILPNRLFPFVCGGGGGCERRRLFYLQRSEGQHEFEAFSNEVLGIDVVDRVVAPGVQIDAAAAALFQGKLCSISMYAWLSRRSQTRKSAKSSRVSASASRSRTFRGGVAFYEADAVAEFDDADLGEIVRYYRMQYYCVRACFHVGLAASEENRLGIADVVFEESPGEVRLERLLRGGERHLVLKLCVAGVEVFSYALIVCGWRWWIDDDVTIVPEATTVRQRKQLVVSLQPRVGDDVPFGCLFGLARGDEFLQVVVECVTKRFEAVEFFCRRRKSTFSETRVCGGGGCC